MAGAIAQGVIGKVTEMIVQKAAQEAGLVCNFTRDFDLLKKSLTTLSGGLKYADSLSTQDDDIKEWLHNVRDVAWDAEDIVDEYAVRPLYTNSVTQSCVCNPEELIFRYRMGKRIQEVTERIRSITKDGERLKLFRDLVQSEQPSSSAAGRSGWKGNSVLPSVSHPVAIEPKLQHLICLIHDSTVPVITVVGMGGAGKTFLLQNAFNRLKQWYELSIWLSVSQSYSVHKLQCGLASQLGDLEARVKDASEERAAELIHAGLQGTKSLIVLDDVWRVSDDDNIITSLGLPIGRDSQCKVVVTTRNRGVAQNLDALIYEMELVSKEDSWQLFCAYAFPNFGRNLPPQHLQAVAAEVEKQCGRLPLALKTIGASLSGCTDSTEWNSRLSRLKQSELHPQKELTNPDNHRIIDTLRLSYDSLPAALKPCFSYLSYFPKNSKVNCEYLINLWIAEGFIPQGEDQWDIAWHYLYQLANLCLVEVLEGKFTSIQCMLLNLATDISKENRFVFDVEDDFTSVKRILLVKKEINDMVIAQSRASCPRSLRTLSLCKNPIQNIEANFLSPMRLLRVLDLSYTQISTLPQCVGKLKLLKLLVLSFTKIEEVPICVRSLKSLVMLYLNGCKQLQRLPQWINELKCLQHLNIEACHDELGNHLPKGISELVSLRVLRSDYLRLSVEDDGFLKLEDVANLTRLQELALHVQHEKELKSIEDGILVQLLKMRDLSIASGLSTETHLPQNITALQDLQILMLYRFAFPNWVCMVINLRQLVLVDCNCSDYPGLEAMPNLIRLVLFGNEKCREVPKAFGKSSGFPKLRFLIIEDFPVLEELADLEDGAMAVLEILHIVKCGRVKKVPEGVEGLRKLRVFRYGQTGTDEFRERLSEGGEAWNKIKTNNRLVDIKAEVGWNEDFI